MGVFLTGFVVAYYTWETKKLRERTEQQIAIAGRQLVASQAELENSQLQRISSLQPYLRVNNVAPNSPLSEARSSQELEECFRYQCELKNGTDRIATRVTVTIQYPFEPAASGTDFYFSKFARMDVFPNEVFILEATRSRDTQMRLGTQEAESAFVYYYGIQNLDLYKGLLLRHHSCIVVFFCDVEGNTYAVKWIARSHEVFGRPDLLLAQWYRGKKSSYDEA